MRIIASDFFSIIWTKYRAANSMEALKTITSSQLAL